MKYLTKLDDLLTAKLVYPQSNAKSIYPILRKSFNLIVENTSSEAETDISFVFSGYAPLSIRIVQTLLGIQTSSVKLLELKSRLIEEPLKSWSSDLFDEYQGMSKEENEQKTVLVYFIGGCTFAEISALRSMENENRNFVIMTDQMINGNTLIKSLLK